MRESMIDLGELSLYMRGDGSPDGPSILFLHGWPQSSCALGQVMATLANEYHVTAIDLPGVGRSVGAPRRADKRTLAGYVRATLGAIHMKNVTMVGHDSRRVRRKTGC